MRNTQSIPHKTNLRSVPVLLAIGLVILLALIGFIGFLAVRKLSELRDEANSRRREYNHRLQLAVELRAEVETVIAEARLHRAFRNGGVRGTPTRFKLNEAKLRLDKLFDASQKLLAGKGEVLPSGERAAWQRVQAVGEVFWPCLAVEEKLPPERSNAEANQTVNQAAPALAAPTPPVEAPPALEFFKCREDLSKAARDLSNVMVAGESSISTDLTLLQDRAASEVKTALWGTLLLGVLVTVLTIDWTRRQLREIRRATQQVLHAEGLTNSVFNSLTSGVLAINEQGGLLKHNQAFLKQFKLNDAELTLQDYRAALAPLPEISAFVERTLHNHNLTQGRRERIEIKPRADRETTQLLDVSVAPLTVGAEEHGRVVVLDDVTEAENTREELRRNRTLSTVGQLTAQVAHEIYNPLGALKLNVELLEMQVNGDKDAQSTVGRLKRGLEHLSTIVMDLRYLTRPREPERKPTDLNALLDEVLELARDRLERSHIFVKRNYAAERLTGDYDPLQLRKVFLNLLINAIEASPRAGEVELQTRRVTAQGATLLAVSVLDHGVGMSAETRRRIFEAFYSTKQHGTGLGMMITQEIIKKHEGRIEIESEEEKGTTVTVYLPG